MKRIKAACITQTLHFLLKEDVSSDYAKKLVTEEVKKYKDSLNKNKTQYKILSEETLADGSVIIEIKKQYNTSPKGNCTFLGVKREVKSCGFREISKSDSNT